MRKLLVYIFLLTVCKGLDAQFSNSWIDYSKTYYKFKVGNKGWTKIPQTVLSAAGLGSVPAQNFQLWSNGKQIPILTKPTGVLNSGEFIEFLADNNTGELDSALFLNPTWHCNNKRGIYSDTVTYFLTVNNNVAQNLRYVIIPNNVVGSSITPEAYIFRRAIKSFENQRNLGAILPGGLHRSIFTNYEGWSSLSSPTVSHLFPALNVYKALPLNRVDISFTAMGIDFFDRNVILKTGFNHPDSLTTINYAGSNINQLNSIKRNITGLSNSILGSGNNLIQFSSSTTHVSDRIAIGYAEIRYPALPSAQFNQLFEFEIEGNNQSKVLEITDFTAASGNTVILINQRTNQYLIGDLSVAGKVRFLLPSSATTDNYLMLNLSTITTSNTITNIQARNFINYNTPANQGNYLIIYNKDIANDASNTNQVLEYRNYRASIEGGNFKVALYDIDELYDQFFYGISKHPLAIKNFYAWASANYPQTIKHMLLVGKGISYISTAASLNNDPINNNKVFNQNYIPTFGYPASDNLLVATNKNLPVVPQIGIGRINAINGNEIKIFLEKLKEYERRQKQPANDVDTKLYQKTILQVTGGANNFETESFKQYMRSYMNNDSLRFSNYGGINEIFFRTTSGSGASNDQIARVKEMMKEGVGILHYFGHSSASNLEFNLTDANAFENENKYPFVIISGCSAGNIYNYESQRATTYPTVSENYVFANKKGGIGFMASSYLGLGYYLDLINSQMFRNLNKPLYNQSFGDIYKKTCTDITEQLGSFTGYVDMHLEQYSLHGDPAVVINSYTLPDYNIEEKLIDIEPKVISVTDPKIVIKAVVTNLGKAIPDSVTLKVTHTLPDNTDSIYILKKIKPIYNRDTIKLEITMDALRYKGLNYIDVWIDPDNTITEITEANNRIRKQFVVVENSLFPIYPYNYAIVNTPNFVFSASTANPVISNATYTMELDTTAIFNSPFKKTFTQNGVGGLIQFMPSGVSFVPNTVYYWRTKTDLPNSTQPSVWNMSSFIYMPSSATAGFNQSHYYQNKNSNYQNIILDSPSREFKFSTKFSAYAFNNGVFPVAATTRDDISSYVDGDRYMDFYYTWLNASGTTIMLNLISPVENKVISRNDVSANILNLSEPRIGACASVGAELEVQTRRNFEFRVSNAVQRKKLMDFIDSIPNGYIILAKNVTWLGLTNNSFAAYVNSWQNDTLLYGSGNSLYHRFKNLGFSLIDSFNSEKSFIFFGKKLTQNSGQVIAQKISQGINDKINANGIFEGLGTKGTITSPRFGPAAQWNTLSWVGYSKDINVNHDKKSVRVYGITNNGNRVLLRTVNNVGDTTLSFIDASFYPYLQLEMDNQDSINATPYQLKHWRIFGKELPEGAIATRLNYNFKDSLTQGEEMNFSVAFKNVSKVQFDSLMKATIKITNSDNQSTVFNFPPKRILVSDDTLIFNYKINTTNLFGKCILFLDVNPNFAQREVTRANNLLNNSFFVKPDKSNPILDVTFDGVHIMNRDIVSAKPLISIKLKDENRFLSLRDTSLFSIKLYKIGAGANGTDSILKTSYATNLRFFPAVLGSVENEARVEINQLFTDGEYKLVVNGKDVVGNSTSDLDYSILFTVINKPMASNLLNYPNPFTTCTQFVFTLTGTTVPDNFKIQILTVTGKVVREITKAEIGPLHIGNNITQYKWCGDDNFGNKLANGVYLYRFVTSNIGGEKIDLFKTGKNVDDLFKAGYGKLVIIR